MRKKVKAWAISQGGKVIDLTEAETEADAWELYSWFIAPLVQTDLPVAKAVRVPLSPPKRKPRRMK